MTKRKSTIDERLAAVKEYTEAGKPYEQIARERGFSYRQVYEWVWKYRKFGIADLEVRRGERKISQTPRSKEEELEKRIAELEHENHLLNWNVNCEKSGRTGKGESLRQFHLERQYEAVRRCTADPVREACRCL